MKARVENRCCSWELFTASALSRDDFRSSRLKGRLLGGRAAARFYSQWLWLLVDIPLFLLLHLVAGLSIKDAGTVAALALAAYLIVMSAIMFDYTSPALVVASSRRTRFLRQGTRIPRAPLKPDHYELIGAEVARRREECLRDLRKPPGWTRRMMMSYLDGWGRTFIHLAISLSLVLSLARIQLNFAPLLATLPSYAMLVSAIAAYLRMGAIAKRLKRSLSELTCPDCSYPMTSIPAAIDPALSGGVNIGPERCHECGCRWPLIPPPSNIVELILPAFR